MANIDDRWVRERLQVLEADNDETPDIDVALAAVRARAAEPGSPKMWSRWQPLRWATAMAALSIGLFAIWTMPARAQRSRVVYSVQVEQALLEIEPGGAERFMGRRWIRIRTDGAHEVTQSLTPPLWFITKTRIIFPDGSAEKFFDLIPIPRQDSPELPASRKVAAGCVSPESSERVVGREVLHGYDTVQMRSPVRGGQIVAWRVPELGCEELQARVEALQLDGSVKPVFVTRLLKVQR